MAGVQMVRGMLSGGVAENAGWTTPEADFAGEIDVRGVSAPVSVFGFKRGRDFPASILAADPDEQIPVRGRLLRA